MATTNAVREWDDDEAWWETKPTRPALEVLERDQRALLEGMDGVRGLLDGFASRREAIEWYQRATVRTFGYLADEWPAAALIQDRALVRALTDPAQRPTRIRAAHTLVLPACNRAYNDLRDRSGEYITKETDDEEPRDLEPSEQRYLAMRPAHSELDGRQGRALRELWGGFGDREALLRWLLDLNQPTHGAIDRELARDLVHDDALLRQLLGESTAERQAARNRFAATILLPAFADAARDLSAGESADVDSSSEATTL